MTSSQCRLQSGTDPTAAAFRLGLTLIEKCQCAKFASQLSGVSKIFLPSDGTPLNCQWLSSTFQSILSSAGDPGCFTGYSFRIGAATSAGSLMVYLITLSKPWAGGPVMHTNFTLAFPLVYKKAWQASLGDRHLVHFVSCYVVLVQ